MNPSDLSTAEEIEELGFDVNQVSKPDLRGKVEPFVGWIFFPSKFKMFLLLRYLLTLNNRPNKISGNGEPGDFNYDLSTAFSDFTIICGDTFYKAHRVILSRESKLFYNFCKPDSWKVSHSS